MRSTRDVSLDVLRGCFVVAMVMAHLACCSSPVYVLTHPLVWVDAALGFVALSGLVLGMVQRRLHERGTGPVAAARVVWRRALLLYGAHLVLLSVGYALRAATGQPRFLVDPATAYDGGWPELLLRSALLLHTDVHLDILPLYVVLLLLVPLAVLALRRGRAALLLAGSAVLWAATLALGSPAGLPGAAGGFGWTAWQLPFTAALVLGWHRAAVVAALAPARRPLLAVAAVVTVAVGTTAHLADRLPAGLEDLLTGTVFSKHPPGPGALVALPAAALTLHAVVEAARRRGVALAWLSLLGRNGLAAYLLLTATVVWLPPLFYAGPWWQRSLLALATLGAAVLLARSLERRRAARRPGSQPPGSQPPGSQREQATDEQPVAV